MAEEVLISVPKPTASIKGGAELIMVIDAPMITFADYFCELLLISALPTVKAKSYSTFSFASFTVPIPDVAVDRGRTAGSFLADSTIVPIPYVFFESAYTLGWLVENNVNKPFAVIKSTCTKGWFVDNAVVPEIEIKSGYTIGEITVAVIIPEVTVESVYTKGSFEYDITTPTATVESVYTLGLANDLMTLPNVEILSTSTSGRFELYVTVGSLSIVSNYTFGFFGCKVKKPSIKYSFIYGTAAGLSISIPSPTIITAGRESTSNGCLSLTIPSPRTRRV